MRRHTPRGCRKLCTTASCGRGSEWALRVYNGDGAATTGSGPTMLALPRDSAGVRGPMATPHTRLMTFTEFEQLPDEVCRRHELRRAELVQVAPPIHEHSLVQSRLRRLLETA